MKGETKWEVNNLLLLRLKFHNAVVTSQMRQRILLNFIERSHIEEREAELVLGL